MQTELHIAVGLRFIVYVFDRNARLFEHIDRIFFVVIVHFAYDALYAAVDDEHCAGSARRHLTVHGRAVDRDAALCRLTDRILFGVYGSDAVL